MKVTLAQHPPDYISVESMLAGRLTAMWRETSGKSTWKNTSGPVVVTWLCHQGSEHPISHCAELKVWTSTQPSIVFFFLTFVLSSFSKKNHNQIKTNLNPWKKKKKKNHRNKQLAAIPEGIFGHLPPALERPVEMTKWAIMLQDAGPSKR